MNAGGSRRGSFRGPVNDTESVRNRGSESKDRMRDGIGSTANLGSGFGGSGPGLPRPNTGSYDHQSLALKRP